MKKSNLRATAALQALAILGAGLTASMIVATPASAQDYTSGAVVGTVNNPAGRPVAGASVSLRSLAQNQVRTLTTDGGGSFTATGMTPGDYQVRVSANGYQPYEGTINVVIAQENRVTVGLLTVGTSADILVIGRRLRQDFTKTTTGLTLDVATLTNQVPVPRSITGLTLLAPTTVKGVAGFGDQASVGGSSVAENAYYINGLNITNPDTYVGSARVPFNFYKTVDVQTGGFAAEFGRATGGVINATTKSGSNTPYMAIHGDFEFSGLDSRDPNTGLATDPDTLGRLRRIDRASLTAEAGGAVIKDHVFLYGLFQANHDIFKSAIRTANRYSVLKDNDPFYGLKADVYINPTQHLEFTYFSTKDTTRNTRYSFISNSTFDGGTIGNITGRQVLNSGGANWVARYTGNLTDFFTVSGAYGISKDAGDVLPDDKSAYFVIDRRTATTGGIARVVSSQPFSRGSINQTRRRFYRVDGDLRFTAVGTHHVRFGLDNEDLSEDKIDQFNGGIPISYDYRNTGARITYLRLGGHVSGKDTAYYAQDSWTPTQGLTVNLGIRDDLFQQSNLSGQKYLDLKNNIGLRAGVSYTPPSADKWKFIGNYGRYFIPPAMNLGFRGRDTFFREFFGYGAFTAATFPIDPVTGTPLAPLGGPISGIGGFSTQCPAISLSSAPGAPASGGANCAVFGAGFQDPAAAKVIPGTKATYEDEFLLGTRYQASERFSIGLTANYRKLKRVSEDTDFQPYLSAFYGCDQGAESPQCTFYNANAAYYIWNPGATSVTLVDFSDVTKKVTLTGLRFPRPQRTYKALTLDWRRTDDGLWAMTGSITLSKSKGSTEGTVKSDAGNTAQVDAGSTQDFDYLGLTDYANGLLPNDRRFVFKAFGVLHITKAFQVGANVVIASPTPGSCQGIHPTDDLAAGYGASSYYCGFGPLNADGSYDNTRPSPRGTGFKNDWLKQLDLSVRFKVPGTGTDSHGLILRADVFNVLNTHSVQQRYSEHELDHDSTGYVPDPLYLTPFAYQPARSIRVGFDWSF